MSQKEQTVFISYTHDSLEHKNKVLSLAYNEPQNSDSYLRWKKMIKLPRK